MVSQAFPGWVREVPWSLPEDSEAGRSGVRILVCEGLVCLGTEDSELGPRGLGSTGRTLRCGCRAVVGSRSWLLRQRLLGCAEKLDEVLAAAADPTLRPDIADADSRAATVKQRPTSRRITPAEISVSRLGGGA